MINRQATALTLTAISILFSSAAFADTTETATADMHVSLTVEKSCQISVGDMDFGSHPSDTGQLTVTSQANVTCTNGTEYQLSSASDHTYEMANDNGDTVAYTIYGILPVAIYPKHLSIILAPVPFRRSLFMVASPPMPWLRRLQATIPTPSH